MTTRLRIGIVGTENTHVDHIVNYLNVARKSDAARVVALAGGHSERNEDLARRGEIERVVDDVSEMMDDIGALIVTSRDGHLHRRPAIDALNAGIPVWVDKPLACTVDDAQAIVAAADSSGTPLTSYSALRWIPDTNALMTAAAEVGTVQTITATGPADPDSPWGGIFFYGIHPVDVVLRIAAGDIGAVEVVRSRDTVLVRTTVGGIALTIELVKPETDGQVPFHVSITGRTGLVGRLLTLGPDYVSPGIETFLSMVRTSVPPVDYQDLLRPIRLLEKIALALSQDPRPGLTVHQKDAGDCNVQG